MRLREHPHIAHVFGLHILGSLAVGADGAWALRNTGPDVRQTGGACSAAQLRNATLTSQLHEVHRSLLGLLPRLPPSAAAALRHAPPPHLPPLPSVSVLRTPQAARPFTLVPACSCRPAGRERGWAGDAAHQGMGWAPRGPMLCMSAQLLHL